MAFCSDKNSSFIAPCHLSPTHMGIYHSVMHVCRQFWHQAKTYVLHLFNVHIRPHSSKIWKVKFPWPPQLLQPPSLLHFKTLFLYLLDFNTIRNRSPSKIFTVNFSLWLNLHLPFHLVYHFQTLPLSFSSLTLLVLDTTSQIISFPISPLYYQKLHLYLLKEYFCVPGIMLGMGECGFQEYPLYPEFGRGLWCWEWKPSSKDMLTALLLHSCE